MDEGYIISNKFRRIIVEGIASGETDIYVIAKKHHIIPNIAKRIAEDLTRGGLLERDNNRYNLTKEGEKIALSIKG